MKFRNEEVEILKKIHALSLQIETTAEDGNFCEKTLGQIHFLLINLKHSVFPELQNISQISAHLNSKMSLRHFLNFMIPIERLLGQTLQDDEFLIEKSDRQPSEIKKFPLTFILENIRSAFNVGSIFRLADCLGAEQICLCGYTPPPDKKTSMGTDLTTHFQTYTRIEEAISQLKAKKVTLCALETAKNSKSILNFEFSGPTALIVGNERFGLETSVLEKVDEILHIPMSGFKNSLNVSNALAMASFEWKRQWIKSH